MRQALEYATDKEGIVNTLGEVPWSYPIYTIIKGIEESAPSDIVPRKYDPAKAKELMTAAGYPDGLKFTLNITIENYREHTDVFTAYQDKWRAVGFDAEIQVNEVAVGREIGLKPLPGNDANYYVLRGNKITPSAVMIESLVEGSTTWVGVKRPEEWPNLLEQALQTEDVDKTLSILAQMNKIAYDQAMAVPSHIDPLVSIVRTYVKDYDIIREGQVIRKAWLDK